MTQTNGGFPDKLSEPAQRALASAGFTRLEELTTVSEAELGKLHGMGPKADPAAPRRAGRAEPVVRAEALTRPGRAILRTRI